MNIIFLDIDGVLNTGRHMEFQWIQNNHKCVLHSDCNFDPICLENFKNLMTETDAKIVISSTWRLFHKEPMSEHDKYVWNRLMENLDSVGAKERYIGDTPYLCTERGVEIEYWLKHTEHKIDNFVIIDDDSDMGEYTETKLAKCNFVTGFDDKVLKKTLKILNKE